MSTPAPPPRPWTSGPYTLRHVFIAYALVFAPLTLAFAFIPIDSMVGENGVVETAQVVILALAAVAALFFAWSRPAFRDRCILIALGSAAALMAAREFDAHLYFNPKRFGPWGVRYRLDWFTDGSVPWHIRICWLTIILGAIASTALPLFLARPNSLAQLKRRDLGGCLFALVIFFIASGWAWDDLLGRGRFLPVIATKTIEELSELAGYVAYFICTWIAVKVPLAQREAPLLPTSTASFSTT